MEAGEQWYRPLGSGCFEAIYALAMPLPHFLIIGAQKSGTTTLFRDLLTQPTVFFPIDKEPGNLCFDDVLTPSGRSAYSNLYRRATREQLCGDATTRYSKLPDFPGVPQRARAVLGAELRLIYLIRNPVSRIVSHHYHDLASGTISVGIDEAVKVDHRFVAYSSYAMQAAPWIGEFGPEQLLVIRFEDFIADRLTTLETVAEFLGFDAHPELVEVDQVFNRSHGKRVASGYYGRMSRSKAYRRFVRPLMPRDTRRSIRHRVLPPAPERPAPPSRQTIEYIIGSLSEDIDRQVELFGRGWTTDELLSAIDEPADG